MTTEKPQKGLWTLIAPDGKKWEAHSPIAVVSLEQRERVPVDIGAKRVLSAVFKEDVGCSNIRKLRKKFINHAKNLDW